jgi:leucyl aminopeptidase
MARHLTNLPPEILHPVSYANFAKSVFLKSKKVVVEIWDEKKLKAKGLGLLLAVGAGSPHQPRLVHMRYRPKAKTETPLYAFIGKGVTFDTGGLDIKGADSMRWMKKDMAGSASVLGLVLWAEQVGYEKAFDCYLALAENAISGDSFAPGDIIQSRSGKTVEVHNTDAEGRLVMADALEVAKETKPLRGLIDVSTLTGAIKVALGPDIPGLFSNHSELKQKLVQSGTNVGEPVWAMPLVQSYRGKLKSTFADMINAADGFGGAVTAALFLQSFAEPLPWAHFDIYGWRESMGGPYSEMGANGQAVQLLADFLLSEG